MQLHQQEQLSPAIRFSMKDHEQKEIARGYLYIIQNDLHPTPYGLVEDVFVEESARGQGVGTQMMQAIIAEAKKQQCYKLILQSRYKNTRAHELYIRLGFVDHGKNFRMDIET